MTVDTEAVFQEPSDAEYTIWRYMDFAKFFYLISTGNLVFPAVKKFVKDDPYEGEWPKYWINSYSRHKNTDEHAANAIENMIKSRQFPLDYVYANCWHINDHGSAAMWRLYLKNGPGVAVRSTLKSLQRVLSRQEHHFYVQRVKYIDFDAHEGEEKFHQCAPFFLKRLDFKHEEELRALIWSAHSRNRDVTERPRKDHINVKVSVQDLVHEVVTSPKAEDWFHDCVEKLVECNGPGIQVNRSKLLDSPDYWGEFPPHPQLE